MYKLGFIFKVLYIIMTKGQYRPWKENLVILSRIAMLLIMILFNREKMQGSEESLKYVKIIYSTKFMFFWNFFSCF